MPHRQRLGSPEPPCPRLLRRRSSQKPVRPRPKAERSAASDLIDGTGPLPYKPLKLYVCRAPTLPSLPSGDGRMGVLAPSFGQRHLAHARAIQRAPGTERARQRRKRRETDLSAKQIGAQAPPRLSRPHGNKGRPQGVGGAARPGTQATECIAGGRSPRGRKSPGGCHGAIRARATGTGAVEATGGFPRRRRRHAGACGHVRAAGPPTRGRGRRARRLHSVASGWQGGRA